MNTYIFQQPVGEAYVPDWLARFFLYAIGFCLVMLMAAGGVNALLGGDNGVFKADPVKEHLTQIEIQRITTSLAKTRRETELKIQKQEKGNL